ncbi:Carbon-nitrogen hydrolase [Tulasnella sp. 419]|nr:Carbon-nitrogen hydrolase [Tulasnella sp. 418]KAG8950966.1 Carbon-nitrogen hydrolase [Tulasnella sp. 419]
MVLAAVAQICSTPSVSQNIRTALTVIKWASAIGAKMVFLPEASDFIAPAFQVASLSKPLEFGQNEYLEKIMTAATESGLWINLGIHESPHGSISSEGEQRCFNTNWLFLIWERLLGRIER